MRSKESTLFNLYTQYKGNPTTQGKDNVMKLVRLLKTEVAKKKGQKHFYSEDGETLLCKAIIDSSEVLARELIEKEEFGINEPSKDGMYPIHHAVQRNNNALVQVLLQKGADINVQEKQQCNTPLHMALKQTVVEVRMVRLLVEKGSDFDMPNRYQDTAFQLAKRYDETDPKHGLVEIFQKAQHHYPVVVGGTIMRQQIDQLSRRTKSIEEGHKELTQKVSNTVQMLEDHKKETELRFESISGHLERTTENVEKMSRIHCAHMNSLLSPRHELGYVDEPNVYGEIYEYAMEGASAAAEPTVTSQPYETPVNHPDRDRHHYNEILDESPSNEFLDDTTRKVLRRRMETFVHHVKMGRILTALYSAEVISEREYEEAKHEQADEHRAAEKLYLNLMRGTAGKLRKAKTVLFKDGQFEVAHLIPDV